MPPRPGLPGSTADPIYKVSVNGDLEWCASPSLSRELRSTVPPKPGPMPSHPPSRTGSSPPLQMPGPMGPGLGPGSNLGSRPGSRPPSMCGSVGGPSVSRGGSRPCSPTPNRPMRSVTTSSTSDSMVLGPKEVAVLAMLQQGLDMLGDHMSSRINRRLDDAHNRVGGLATKFSSLRTAIRHSFPQATAHEHRPTQQPEQKPEQQPATRGRVPLGATSTNQIHPTRAGAACKVEQNLREPLPAVASSHSASQPGKARGVRW